MTYSFIQAIERGHGATYGSMLNSMRSTIRNTDSGSELSGAGGIVTSLVTMLLTGGSLSGGFRQVFIFVMFVNCYGYGLSSSLFDRFVSRLLLGFLIDGLAHTYVFSTWLPFPLHSSLLLLNLLVGAISIDAG